MRRPTDSPGFVVLRRSLFTFLRDEGERIVGVRWILISATLATFSFASVFVTIAPVINILLMLTTLVMIGLDIHKHLHLVRQTTFAPRVADDFEDVREALEVKSDRFRFLRFAGQSFVLDTLVSRKIAGGLPCHLSRSQFILRPELRSHGARFRRTYIEKRANIFNGPVIGWGTGVADGACDDVEFFPARFFDRISSDFFAKVDTRRDGDIVYEGRRLFIDRFGHPRDFDASWLVNGVGVSTIAITTDGMLVFTTQSTRNAREGGHLAPSGSGSLEPRDFVGGRQIIEVAEIAIRGANRELCEEVAVSASEIEATFFLGFGRWLDEAANPELFCLTVLKIESHDLRARKREVTERPYVDGVILVRPSKPVSEWAPGAPDEVLPQKYRNNLSLPLAVCLSLVASVVTQPCNPMIVEHLRLLGTQNVRKS